MKIFTKNGLAAIAILLFSLLSIGDAEAQKFRDSTLVKIVTVDGNEFMGKILSQNENEFRIRTETLGEVAIPKLKIKSIEKVDKTKLVDGEIWEQQPQESRYFFGPSGYGLRKGEGYFQNTGLLLNQVNYGATDNFSIGGGIMPFPFFTPVWFTPKLSFPYKTGKGSAGIGLLYFNVFGSWLDLNDDNDRWQGAGMLYGMNTWGSREHQYTIGMGYGFADGLGWANYPTFMLSTMHRNSKRWAFISENYMIPGDGSPVVLISGGMRYLGKVVTVDFGLFLALHEEFGGSLPLLPWYSIAFPWQSKGKN